MCSEKSQTKTLRVKSDEIDTKQYEKFASSCAGRLEAQRPGQTLPAIGGETLFNKTLFPSTNQVARGGSFDQSSGAWRR